MKAGDGQTMRKVVETYLVDQTNIPYTSKNTQTVETDYFDDPAVAGTAYAIAKNTKVVRTIDNFGNTTHLENYGNNGIAADDTTTVRFFAENTTAFIVDQPSAEIVYAGQDTSAAGTILAQTRYSYDGQAYGTPPLDGDLTTLARQRDLPTLAWATETRDYDSFGNVIAVVGEDLQRTEYDYHPTYHTFVVATRLPRYFALGADPADTRFQTTTAWNVVCGKPATDTDVNLQQTIYTYDALCRPKRTDMPGGDFAENFYVSVGTPTAQNTRTVRKGPAGQTNIWSEVYYDGVRPHLPHAVQGPRRHGRRRHPRRHRLHGAWPDRPPDRTIQESDPGIVATNTATYPWVGFLYDALDRETRQTNADGTQQNTLYLTSTATGGFDAIQVTDEIGRKALVHRDAFGREVLRQRQNGAGFANTTITLDRLGRVTGVTDPKGSLWVNTYDSLGQRLSATDPDLGTWSYTYDLSGRLLTRTDARGRVIQFTYDQLDRVKSKQFSGTPTDDIANIYDETRAGAFNTGRLTTTANTVASIAYDYDLAGRTVRERTTVDPNLPTQAIYALQATYDEAGRLLSRTFPDGQVVGGLTYDGAGRLAPCRAISPAPSTRRAGRRRRSPMATASSRPSATISGAAGSTA